MTANFTLTSYLCCRSHMGGMGTHPLGSPMSSYYTASMSSMPGLSPNFGMPVSMYSSTGQSPMSMGMSTSMSGLGVSSGTGAGAMSSQTGAGLSNVSAYPSTTSPYPGNHCQVRTILFPEIISLFNFKTFIHNKKA